MVAPYSNSIQNNNKCPHGFPVGSCPICSGMGGTAPKDKNKPRKSGEMSYNECLAAWHRMQREELRENKAQLDAKHAQNVENSILQNRLNFALLNKFDNFISKLNNLQKQVSAPLKPVLALIGKIGNFISNATKNIFAFYQNTAQTIVQLMNSISEKLSSFLGEIKNFSQNFKIISKTKKIIKTVLSLFLSKNSEEEQEENEEILRLKLREIKNSFLRIFIQDEEKIEKEKENEHSTNII